MSHVEERECPAVRNSITMRSTYLLYSVPRGITMQHLGPARMGSEI